MIMNKTFLIEPTLGLQRAIFAALLALTALIYYPGLSGGFLFDDFYNIVNNPSIHLQNLSWNNLLAAAFSSDAGLLKRPLAMLSFALNGYLGGITTENLKATNLAIHLVNGLLVYRLVRVSLRAANFDLSTSKAAWTPLLVLALWLFAPINLTTVLYSIQRMTGLAALFTFAGLAVYVQLRIRQIEGEKGWAATPGLALIVFTALSTLAKESGILLPLLALCYELTILRFETSCRNQKIALYGLFFLTCMVPAGLLAYILSKHAEILMSGYEIRDFSLVERLLTEARVIWLYLYLTILPSPTLLGMYHDDIALSHGLFTPSSTFFALIGIAVLLELAIALRKKQPVIALGILLFFAGHSMESTFLPLEIAHEHRNYFPSFGVFLALIGALQLLPRGGYWLAVCMVLAFAILTAVRASLWGSPLDLALMEVRHHPASPRANYEAARIYAQMMRLTAQPKLKNDYYHSANQFFLKSSGLEQSHISGLLGSLSLSSLYGVEPDHEIIRLAIQRLKEQKITSATMLNMRRLHECEMAGHCAISGELVYDLQLAAIANPHISPGILEILMSQATARALHLGRFSEGLAIARDAAQHSPGSAQLGLNYSTLLIQMQFFDVAKAELERIAALHPSGNLAEQLSRQWALMDKHQDSQEDSARAQEAR